MAHESNLPFWGILLVTPHLSYRDPDDALVRWQVAQWLSYGAHGIGYFTYWSPSPDSNVHWGDGMIRWGTGERMRAFFDAMRLETLDAVRTWPRDRPAPALPVMRRITLRVILRTALGLPAGPEMDRFERRIERCMSVHPHDE